MCHELSCSYAFNNSELSRRYAYGSTLWHSTFLQLLGGGNMRLLSKVRFWLLSFNNGVSEMWSYITRMLATMPPLFHWPLLIEAELRKYALVSFTLFVQIMACSLVGAKPLSEPMLKYIVNWTLRIKLLLNMYRNSYIFIHENQFENVVWNLAAILFRPQCVNLQWPQARTNKFYSAVCVYKGQW